MTYQIVGRRLGQAVLETRIAPASAVLLAERWLTEGMERVRIVSLGRAYELAAFRDQFVLTAKGLKLRTQVRA